MSGHAHAEPTHDAHSHAEHAHGDDHGHGHAAAITPLHTHFTPAELDDLDDADTEAGRNIGKMLTVLFIYTIVAMLIVSVWTWLSIKAQVPLVDSPAHATEHAPAAH